jgi:hypothetical protein
VYAQDVDPRAHTARIVTESQVRNEFSVSKTFSFEVAIEDLTGRLIRRFSGGRYMLAPGETKIVSAAAQLEVEPLRPYQTTEIEEERDIGTQENLHVVLDEPGPGQRKRAKVWHAAQQQPPHGRQQHRDEQIAHEPELERDGVMLDGEDGVGILAQPRRVEVDVERNE